MTPTLLKKQADKNVTVTSSLTGDNVSQAKGALSGVLPCLVILVLSQLRIFRHRMFQLNKCQLCDYEMLEFLVVFTALSFFTCVFQYDRRHTWVDIHKIRPTFRSILPHVYMYAFNGRTFCISRPNSSLQYQAQINRSVILNRVFVAIWFNAIFK